MEATVHERCSAEGCVETAAVAMDERRFCRAHFLAYSYRSLEATAAQFQQPQFHELHADAASRFLEECMRQAAEIACAPVVPGNFERAQVLDVLLWASELYGRLRRGPRSPARLPILLRSKAADPAWEEATETQILSRHGAQVHCRHDVRVGDALICVRLDSNRQTEARVVWTRSIESGGDGRRHGIR